MGEIAKFYVMPHPTMIIPEMGEGEEKKITATAEACEKVADEIAKIKPDTVVILTPHGAQFANGVAFSVEEKIYGQAKKNNETKFYINLDVNVPLSRKIMGELRQEGISSVGINKDAEKMYGVPYELDFGTIIPMYFVDKKLDDYKIVHISCGQFLEYEFYKVGMIIKKAIEESDSKTVFITSAELSHKLKEDGPLGYSPDGEKFDKEITSLLSEGDVRGIYNMDNNMIESVGTCGMSPFYTMLGAMNGNKISGDVLSYEAPFGIGYPTIDFSLEPINEDTYELLLKDKEERFQNKVKDESLYVRLARESITKHMLNGGVIEIPSYVTDEMKETEGGVFVKVKLGNSIVASGGSIAPKTNNAVEETIISAIETTKLKLDQTGFVLKVLDRIDIFVDVVQEVETVEQEDLDPSIYGIQVRSGLKIGLAFPRIPEVNTVEEQLKLALKKGNISPYDDYTIERFKVTSYK